jgi:hypothetical protein
MKKTMNEVFRIIPDQRDFLKYFHTIIDEDYNLSGEMYEDIRWLTQNYESRLSEEELLKIGIVPLLLMAAKHVHLEKDFVVYGIRNQKSGEEYHSLFGNCHSIRDGLAVMDLIGWNTSSLYRLTEPLDSDNFCFISNAHDLFLGANKAFLYRGSGSSDMFFYLISDQREDDKEVSMYGSDTSSAEGEGPFSGGPFTKFWFENGFVDKAYHPVSPNIFRGGSSFSEGMAAACISGRWGYLNESFHFVIKPELGYAEPFSGGIARVLILDEESSKRKGKWVYYSVHFPLVGTT